jgi:hypothetical protein
MATTEKLQFIIEAEDNTKKALNSVQSGIESVQKKVEDLQPAFQKMAAIGTAGLVAVGAVAYKAVTAFAEVERSQRQLENAIIGVSKGTKEQVAEVNKITSALQKKAGIDADSLTMGVAQLSTFGLQSKSVIDLTKSMADLTVNQNGLNATSDQYIASANIVAKALRGEFGMLQKMGIRFTEAQKKVIEFGTEQEKVAAIQQGFAQNLRETTDTVGGLDLSMALMQRTVEDINEGIGQALAPTITALMQKLQPIIENILTWATENPKLLATILGVTAGMFGLLTVVGLLGIAIPAVTAGFALLASPFTIIALALTGIVALFLIFKDQIFAFGAYIEESTGLFTFFKDIWAQLSLIFTETLIPAFQRFWAVIQPFLPVLGFIAKAIGAVLLGAILGTIEGLKVLIQMFTWVFDIVTKIAAFFIDGMVNSIQAVIDKIKALISFVKDLIANLKEIGIGGVVKSIGGKIKGLFGGGSQSVDDAIISPNGNVITTHPDDYIMAMKDPSLLAQGAGGITINITGNSFMGKENIAEQIGNDLMKIVKQNMKL